MRRDPGVVSAEDVESGKIVADGHESIAERVDDIDIDCLVGHSGRSQQQLVMPNSDSLSGLRRPGQGDVVDLAIGILVSLPFH